MKTLFSLVLLLSFSACSGSSSETPVDGGGADLVRFDLPPGCEAGAQRHWSVSEIDTKPVFKARVAIAAGSDGVVQMAYNVATSADGWSRPELWYGENGAGSWNLSQIVTTDDNTAIEFPTMVIDGNNRTHIFFNRYIPSQEQVELFHIFSDDGQVFSTPVNLTQTTAANEYAPVAFLEGQDTIHLLFQQTTDEVEGIGYLKVVGGVPGPVEEVAVNTQLFSLSPDYALAAVNGAVHVIYGRPGPSPLETVLYSRSRQNGSWGPDAPITPTTGDSWSPAMVTDASGTVHVSYVTGVGDSKNLTYDRIVNGAFVGSQALSSSPNDMSYYLGMKAASDGTIHIAFLRFYLEDPQDPSSMLNGDVLHISGKNGVFGAEARLTNTPGKDESHPSIALGTNGEVYISFVENFSAGPAGIVYLASYL